MTMMLRSLWRSQSVRGGRCVVCITPSQPAWTTKVFLSRTQTVAYIQQCRMLRPRGPCQLQYAIAISLYFAVDKDLYFKCPALYFNLRMSRVVQKCTCCSSSMYSSYETTRLLACELVWSHQCPIREVHEAQERLLCHSVQVQVCVNQQFRSARHYGLYIRRAQQLTGWMQCCVLCACPEWSVSDPLPVTTNPSTSPNRYTQPSPPSVVSWHCTQTMWYCRGSFLRCW